MHDTANNSSDRQCDQCCTKILSFNLYILPLKAGNTHHWNIFCQKQLQSEWPAASNPVSYQAIFTGFWSPGGFQVPLKSGSQLPFTYPTLHYIFCPLADHTWQKKRAAVFSVQILSQKLLKSMSFKKQDKKHWTSTTFPWRALWWSRRRRQLWRCTWDSIFRLFLVTIQTSFFRQWKDFL